MNTSIEPRRYRFAPLHRAGLFGALPPTLLITLGLGVITSWLAVIAGAPLPVALIPIVGCGIVGFGRLGGRPLHTLIPSAAGWWWRRLRHRHHWCRPVPLLVDGAVPQALPPALDGIELFEVAPDSTTRAGRGQPVGVVRDRAAGVVTAVLRVSGDGQFALADAVTQDTKVDLWGLALAGFCREASPVARVTWHDWTSPTGVGDHPADVRERWAGEVETPARAAYLALVDAVAPTSVRHEVLVEVTVDVRKIRHRSRRPTIDVATDRLLQELSLFVARLEHAGLHVDPPLSSAELTTAMRVRSDPSVVDQLGRLQRSLAAASGRAAPELGPMAVEERWAQVHVDGAVHRSWWFARWPRREVPAGWLDQILFGVSSTRTVTVVFEPIAPSRSDRDIDKESVARETNKDDKARRGFRVKAADRKAAREVTLREAELNDGYSELAYVGLLTITTANTDEIEEIAGAVEQTAAQAGVELRPLYARQAAGWVASLPLGRTVARRWAP